MIDAQLKYTFQNHFETLFENSNVIITTDYTTRFMNERRMDKNDLIFILSCGNGTTTVTADDSSNIHTEPFTLTCICPVTYNKKNNVCDKLSEWFIDYAFAQDKDVIGIGKQSDGGVYEYYGYFDILEPSCDSVVRQYAGQQVVYITISGNLLYRDDEFYNTIIPYISINGTRLKGVTSLAHKNSVVTSDYQVYGQYRQQHVAEYISTMYVISFIVDFRDLLHLKLINGKLTSASFTMKWQNSTTLGGSNETETFTAYISIDAPMTKGQFSNATLTIVR